MTLDEAIKHCEEKAKELREKAIVDYENNKTTLAEFADCRECASEHEQLAEWLKELKAYKESPKSDLISRKALREDLRRFFPAEVLEGIDPKTLFAQIMHDIDNAPTVEQKQGEWIHYLGCGIGKAVCSECNQIGETKKYCGNCGADMRKGGAV